VSLVQPAIDSFLLAFPALFSIVNPLAGSIIFHEVTADRTHGERVSLARRVGVYSAIVMLVALWAGSYILNFFGISLNALRIAGGLVVAVRAWELLSTPEEHEQRKQDQAAPAENARNVAFFPLTLPFTTGPGTIAVAVAIGTEHPSDPSLIAFFLGISAAAIGIAVIIIVAYGTADRLAAALGASGRQVVSRLAAFLLLGIGVQIMLSGAGPFLHQALSPA
jgi:multiple antibiotic resistance protein